MITSIKDPDDGMLVKQRPVSMVPEKVTIYRCHIPHQVEIDRALAELRSKVIRQLVVNFEMTDLIREYDRSVHFKDIYSSTGSEKGPGRISKLRSHEQVVVQIGKIKRRKRLVLPSSTCNSRKN